VGREMQGVADTQEPLDRDGHRHEDGSAEPDVCDWVDDVGKGDGVCIAICIECLEGVVDTADNNINSIKTCQGKKKLVKAVFQFGF